MVLAKLPENGATVAQAVEAGANPGFKLPAVAPNYITRLEEPPVSDTAEVEDNVSDEAKDASASPRSWSDATEAFNDPYLIPGEKFDSHDAFDETSVSGNNGSNKTRTITLKVE